MLNRSLLKTSLLIAGLTTLAACGSDSDSSDDDLTDSSTTSDSTEVAGVSDDDSATADTDVDIAGDDTDPATVDTDVDNTGAVTGDLANPVPQIITATCDASLISATPFSNLATAPALFAPNEIVRGRIDPEAAGNTQHFWNIDLQPGFYHLVLDTRRVDDLANRNIGLNLVDLNGLGQDDGRVLLDDNESNEFRFRQSIFFEVETADTLNLQVTPRFDAEDYTLGIFENGSAIPSPVTEECPEIVTLSLDTTETLILPASDAEIDDLFFQIELELGDYNLNATASRVDGAENRIIRYDFESVDQFGENDRFDEVLDVSETNIAVSTNSDVLTVSEDGLIFLRLRSGIADPQNIEFTLSPAN